MTHLEPASGFIAAILLLRAAEVAGHCTDDSQRAGRTEPVEIPGPSPRLAGRLSVGSYRRLSDEW